MLTYEEALDHLDEFADEEIEEAFDKCDDSSSISIERAVSTVVASMEGAARAVAFIYGKTCDEVTTTWWSCSSARCKDETERRLAHVRRTRMDISQRKWLCIPRWFRS